MEGRKFDMRVYVLVTHDMNLYFFREGYLRMTCAPYDLQNIENEYAHLTNNAIQRNCPEYGLQEDGN
jgi:tubulin--tyrosine ligase/tubulin polyglutamylase TTLL9